MLENSSFLLSNPQPIDHFLTVYMFLLIITGAIGNTFVIYASVKYTSLDMDSVTIFFVRHLAYADLLIVVLNGLPILLTHIFDSWRLGSLLCTTSAYCSAVLTMPTLNFTAIVGLHRLLRCTYPQKLRVFKKKHAQYLAHTTWALSCISGVAKMCYKLKGTFIPAWATCFFDIMRDDYPPLLGIIAAVSVCIPSLTLLISNIFLIISSAIHRKRAANDPHRNGKVPTSNKTVYLISLLYFVSWLPFFVSELFQMKGYSLPTWAHNVLNHFYLIRNVGNPVIYCVVNRKFHNFAIMLIRRHYPNNSNLVDSSPKIIRAKISTVFENAANADHVSPPIQGGSDDGITVFLPPVQPAMVAMAFTDLSEAQDCKMGPGDVYIGW